MPLETLWESICRLAGTDGTTPVQLSEAVDKSAVPHNVAAVEVRLMMEDGLLQGNEETVQLTERGRKSCFEASSTRLGDNTVIAPE